MLIETTIINKVLFGLSLLFITIFVVLNLAFIGVSLYKGYIIEDFTIIYLLTWSCLIIWFLIALFINYLKVSGSPYKSPQHRINLKYVSLVFFIWTVAFSLKIAFFAADVNGIISDNAVLYSILLVLLTIMSDVIPYFSILELKFIELFKKQSRRTENSLDEHSDDEDGRRGSVNEALVTVGGNGGNIP